MPLKSIPMRLRFLAFALALLVARAGAALDVPVDHPEVRFFVGKYLTEHRKWLEASLERYSYYATVVESVLTRYGLPKELSVLPILESGYNGNAVSRTRAVGYWQFMSFTARRYGLDINRWVDERRDIEKSTRAAARYLKDLYSMFGDWDLALVAYNAGEGYIRDLLAASGIDDFWTLARCGLLPRQAREFVPRFYALLWIVKNADRIGLGPIEKKPLEKVFIRGGVDLRLLARYSGVSYSLLRQFNPFLRRGKVPPWGAYLYVPARYAASLRRGQRLLVASLRGGVVAGVKKGYWYRYVVKRGDTLWSISRSFGVSVSLLKVVNRLRGCFIRPGDVLLIPTLKLAERIVECRPRERAIVYRVRRGDTLWRLSRIFGADPQSIMRVNGVSRLRPGQKIKIVLRSGGNERG